MGSSVLTTTTYLSGFRLFERSAHAEPFTVQPTSDRYKDGIISVKPDGMSKINPSQTVPKANMPTLNRATDGFPCFPLNPSHFFVLTYLFSFLIKRLLTESD